MEKLFNSSMGIVIALGLVSLIVVLLVIALKGYRDSISYKEVEKKDTNLNKFDDEN